MPRNSLLLLLPVAICMLVMPGDVYATNYFVDAATGNDANNGLTEGAAWLTLQRAMTTLVAGDTVFVKAGTYDAGTGEFATTNAGTASQPIAIRAFGSGATRHHPVLTKVTTNFNNCTCLVSPCSTPQCENDVVIHITHSFVIWDGFTLAAHTSIRSDGATGNIIENMIIDKGNAFPSSSTFQNGNYDGIFLNQSHDIIIRNNVIKNVFYIVDGVLNTHQNAAGIVLFDTTGIQVRNNKISGCNTGIYDKRNGVNNIHELNYITDSNSKGFLLNAFTATACGACPVTGLRVRQNVIVNAPKGLDFSVVASGGQVIDDLRAHNNVLFKVGEGFREPGNISNLSVYNNIIHLDTTQPVSPIASYAYSDFPPSTTFPPGLGFVSDFSNFSATATPFDRMFPVEFGTRQTLTQWRTNFGVDLNSSLLSATSNLVGPLSSSSPPTAFMLQPGSALRGAGRVDGVPGGAAVNIGAYITDTELIGPPTDTDTVPPSPPLNPRIL